MKNDRLNGKKGCRSHDVEVPLVCGAVKVL